MDIVAGTTALGAPSSSKTPSFPAREDCWSEDATFTLIEAWGERHVSLNRGNLRQKHWDEVADAINARHVTAHNPKSRRRTDVQCKNRVDTLKKKYKIEKARVSDSSGAYASPWPFFSLLESFIGAAKFQKPSPPPLTHRKPPPLTHRKPPPPLTWNFPVAPRSATVKRRAPSPSTAGAKSWMTRTLDFSAFAAVAAAAEAVESEESEGSTVRARVASGVREEREGEVEVGYVELAMAIERFAEIYERVEGRKQRKMAELEKEKMRFVKECEDYKMQLFMETTQHQLRKIKRAKRSSSYSSPAGR